ncbi:MAG: hypothetical protein NC177_13055 [Ruminococcus flavefaciens]|nr:hypothetical protein [Ruminococcus flavefaciens]
MKFTGIKTLISAGAVVFGLMFSEMPAMAESKAELPTLKDVVEANNFIVYCEKYDNMYMDYISEKNPCKAFYTEEDDKSFYIKYTDDSSYEIVTEDYALSYDSKLDQPEYYLFCKSSDELMYRISIAPEPRPRVMLSSYISKVDVDTYNNFFEEQQNIIIDYKDGNYIWGIDYSGVDWLDGYDEYILDPETLSCREFTYYDEDGKIISRWISAFNVEENPVPETLGYEKYTEPTEKVTVELYEINDTSSPIKTWEVAPNSSVNIYGETAYTDTALKNKFKGKIEDSGVLKLYVKHTSIKSEKKNVFAVLLLLTGILVVIAYIIEKLACLRLRRKK